MPRFPTVSPDFTGKRLVLVDKTSDLDLKHLNDLFLLANNRFKIKVLGLGPLRFEVFRPPDFHLIPEPLDLEIIQDLLQELSLLLFHQFPWALRDHLVVAADFPKELVTSVDISLLVIPSEGSGRGFILLREGHLWYFIVVKFMKSG